MTTTVRPLPAYPIQRRGRSPSSRALQNYGRRRGSRSSNPYSRSRSPSSHVAESGRGRSANISARGASTPESSEVPWTTEYKGEFTPERLIDQDWRRTTARAVRMLSTCVPRKPILTMSSVRVPRTPGRTRINRYTDTHRNGSDIYGKLGRASVPTICNPKALRRSTSGAFPPLPCGS